LPAQAKSDPKRFRRVRESTAWAAAGSNRSR
jgi:hypothetical protein